MMSLLTQLGVMMAAAGVAPPVAASEIFLDPVSRHTALIGTFNGDQTIRRESSSGGSSENIKSNTGYSTGKRYFEFRMDATTGSTNNYHMIGIAPSSLAANSYPGSTTTSWGLEWQTGLSYNNSTPSGSPIVSAGATVGDVISVAVDFDAGKGWWAKNGFWANGATAADVAAGTNPSFTFTPGATTYYVCASLYSAISPSQPVITARLKKDEMRYNLPTGFTAWAPPTSQWETELAADGPIGLYRFNEFSGDIVFHNSLYNTNTTFTSSAGTHTSSESGWPGPGGRALNITSSSTYLTASDSAAFRITGDYTAVMAFALSSLPSSGTYFTMCQCAGSGEAEPENSIVQVMLDNHATNGMGVRMLHEYGAGVNEDVRVNFPFIVGVSYVVHVERDTVAKTYTVYVNGELIGSVGYANNPTGGTNSVQYLVGNLGISGGSSANTFLGNFDEWAMYNKRIGAARIKAHYAGMISDIYLYTDTFDTDTLSRYTQYSDSAGAWSIASGALTCVGGGHSVQTLNGLACSWASAKLTRADDAGIVLRFRDNNNYYVVAIADASSTSSLPNRISLYKRVAGAFTQIGSNVSISFTRGTEHELEYRIIGTHHIIKFDGVTVLTATDTAHAWNSSGGAGPRNSNYAGDANATSIFTEFKCYSVDPSYLSMVTHLTFDGDNGSQNFRDRCGKKMSWYNYTDSAIGALSTGWAKWGLTSLGLTTGSLRGVTSQSSANFTMGAGSWRVAFWYKPSTMQTTVLFDMRPEATQGAYITLFHDATGVLSYYVNTASRISSAAGAIAAGGEYFIEVNKDSTTNTTRMFINGVLIGSYSDTTTYVGTVIMFGNSGQNRGGGFYANGYLDDLIVKKGVAGPTAAYPVPAVPAGRGAHA